MAVDMFLKLGDFKGESQDSAHAGEIDVLSWSWGMSNPSTMHVQGSASAGKVSINDISVTKYVDRSSTNLILSACNSKVIPTAVLTLRSSGEKPVEFIKITLTNVIVNSFSTGGSGGEDSLTENISLNFEKFKYEYTPQKKDKTPDATIPVSWDIPQNKS